ncbi:MAG: helix-turn-helix transcriptional regulator [Muribaculaceae bacterium]|nr:helix-turn-helix transcriptional regulator [Muribaculaceae bacterium]
MNSKEFGAILRERRKEVGITQQELADLAEVNINTIVTIERGDGNPKIQTIIGICEVLGLEILLK